MAKLIKISALVMLLALAYSTYQMPIASADTPGYEMCQDGDIVFHDGDSCTDAFDCITVEDGVLSDWSDDAMFPMTLESETWYIPAPMCINGVCSFDDENYIGIEVDTCETVGWFDLDE